MEGTFHATNGSPGAHGSVPPASARLVALAVMAFLGCGLIIWVSRTTWQRVDRLQRQFASLQPDNFLLGARLRVETQRLNDTLLRYRLLGDTNDYNAFRARSAALREWLAQSRTNVSGSLEQDFLAQVQPVFDTYMAESGSVLEANRKHWLLAPGLTFQDSYEKVQDQSRHLLVMCNVLIERQRAAFGDFLQESNRTLTTFKNLLRLSVALLCALAAALVVLVYRGMIAPLRLRLDQTQAIIVRQEKLASLGVLAAGVAHEVRNPLTAIKFRLFSLRKTLVADHPAQEDAAVIGQEINRLERIVQDFLQFARPSEPEPVEVPARRIVEEVRELLAPQLEKSAIELRLAPAATVWVRADTHQIKQVLINLIQNAADSIGHGGVITLGVRGESRSTRDGLSDAAVLEVTDNGKGIPPEVQQRLFDPFFTTKEGGTGLGLPIAARIVEKHGGELRYRTEPRRGTTFSVILPRVHQHETHPAFD